SVLSAASWMVPARSPSINASHTASGLGIDAVDVAAAITAHTTTTPAMPARGGNASCASLRIGSLLFAEHQGVDLRHDAPDEDVVEVARPGCVDPELFEQPARSRRHHEDAIREEHGLPHVVRDEQERRASARAHPRPLHLVL